MKVKLLIIALLPLLFASCDLNDLFDEGDANKIYDGPAVVAFYPQEREVDVNSGSTEIEIQLIAETRSSDLSISFSVDGANSTAEAGVHYNLATSSPVTLPAGEHSVYVVIELIEDSVDDGEEVRLILELEGAEGVPASENLKNSRIFIRG